MLPYLLIATLGTFAAQSAPTCVAIPLPSVQGVEGNATEVAGAVRDLFTSFLSSPVVRIVPLDARLASRAIDEAREKDCDHILLATLTRKRSGGSFVGKALGQAAGTASWYVPVGGSVGSAVARGAAAGAGQAAATLATSTKAKDEVQIEYRIAPLDTAATAPSRTERAKARADREDLLTPLVERVATAIVAATAR